MFRIKRIYKNGNIISYFEHTYSFSIIFAVWISTFSGRLKTEQVVGVDRDENKPTMIESIKRKTTLLLGDMEVPQIGSPVEYKRLGDDTKDLASSTESELTLEEKTGISTTTNDESFEDIIEGFLEEKKDVIEAE